MKALSCALQTSLCSKQLVSSQTSQILCMVIERHKLPTTILLHSLIPRFEATILLHNLIPRFEAAILLHSLIPRFEAAISLVCKDINLFFLLSSLSSWELRGIEG